jgi:predicted enzyme related to lactoylglutathione lyase
MSTETANNHALLEGKTFCWHEVYGPSAEAAIDFYTKALDFGVREMDMGPMGKYHMLTREGQGVCGVMATNTPEMANVPPHWSTYLAVDDVDARLAKCKELGATVVVPPMDIPTVGRMTLIADPQGAHIWLFKPEPM